MRDAFQGTSRFARPTPKPTDVRGGCDFPDIENGDPGNTRPALLLIGDSGTGKSFGIRRLLEGNKKILVLDVENKTAEIEAYGPKVIRIGAPYHEGTTLRQPTYTEQYRRLQFFAQELRNGKFREHAGETFDILAIDGLMELAEVFRRYHVVENPPKSEKKDGDDIRAGYGLAGMKTIDFIKDLKNAASVASKLFGFAPMGLVATCGEKKKLDKFGNLTCFEPILPGNITPDMLPFQFGAIVRLDVERDEVTNAPSYIAHTVRSDKWFAKVPSGLFEPKEVMNEEHDMNWIYDTLLNYYQNTGTRETK